MRKHIFSFLLLLSVTLGVSQHVAAAEFEAVVDAEQVNVCRFDINHDGIVNIADFAYIRRQLQDWDQDRRDAYMLQFRQSFGRMC